MPAQMGESRPPRNRSELRAKTLSRLIRGKEELLMGGLPFRFPELGPFPIIAIADSLCTSASLPTPISVLPADLRDLS